MIDGVKVKGLTVIPDERGRLMEILRNDDDFFLGFGQVYMTTARPGVAKAWHYHKKQTDNFTCIVGKMRLALYDAREDSPTHRQTQEFEIDLKTPILVQIPPNVWHGFKAISETEAFVINIPTLPYDRKGPDEYRHDPYDPAIPYDWRR